MSPTTTTTPSSTTPKVTADVTKSGRTVIGRFTLKNLPTLPSIDVAAANKPLFAAVGVADYAIAQVKSVPSMYAAEVKRAQVRLADAPSAVLTLPATVLETVEQAAHSAVDLFTMLSIRGERVVTQIRRQPATEAAIAEGKEAVRKAEAAAAAARRSVKAGEKAVEGAAAKIG
ncbi:MAG TPA: hypothetical protein VNA30_00785 [Mycobacteriales bacterium]|nr:hypothetical protein [Mycobacteriales bacterium]